MIKLTLECQECGNKVELLSNQHGSQVQVSKIRDKDFKVEEIVIKEQSELDVEAELNRIRIDCGKCSNSYIVLEDFILY